MEIERLLAAAPTVGNPGAQGQDRRDSRPDSQRADLARQADWTSPPGRRAVASAMSRSPPGREHCSTRPAMTALVRTMKTIHRARRAQRRGVPPTYRRLHRTETTLREDVHAAPALSRSGPSPPRCQTASEWKAGADPACPQ